MDPIVQISEGKIKGTIRTNSNDEQFYSFTCIPYGKAPVGNLRFKAPEPVEPWTDIKDATKEENFCFQANFITHEFSGSEDCLSLHVFTKKLPSEEKKLKPVMVYIHGGGFMFGSHETNLYGPEHLMTEDIVLVSITYRVGFLGFLRFNDLSLEVPGNAGLKDQVLALKWVQRNIKHFNGDPNNVTIFGESAGGASVEYLVLSPAAKNLFHRAIMQSGSTLNFWARGKFEPADLAAYLGQPNLTEKEILKLLEELSIEELYKLQSTYSRFKQTFIDIGIVSPVVEKPNRTAFLTKEPIDIIQSGEYNAVPVMTGYNNTEGAIFLLFDFLAKAESRDTSKNYKTKALLPYETNLKDTHQVKKMCDILDNFYGKEDNMEGRISLGTDAIFAAGILISARHQAKISKNPVYLYRFSVNSNVNIFKKGGNIKYFGASHGDEICYLFKTLVAAELEESDKIIQKNLITLWTNFAKYGHPTPKGNTLNIEWKPIEGDQLHYLDIDSDLKMDLNPDSERMAVWNQIYKMNPVTAKYVQ